jgi:23S rRNA pseudouridine1911/1915/1917 synthase
MKLEIIYEDDQTLIVNKPAGLVVHSDGRTEEPTLVDALLKKYPKLKGVGGTAKLDLGKEEARAGIVHRLDRETSGVIVVAKNDEAFQFYQDQFKGREVKKTYHGIAWGNMREDIGTINRPLGRSTKDFRMRVVGSQARGTMREAVTKYRVIERAKGFSFMEFYPLTGRTHQIRAHMRSAGYPLVSDDLYGTVGKGNALGLDRVALHSVSLKFKLFSGKDIEVKAPYPKDFENALKELHSL